MGQSRSNRLASLLPWILLPILFCGGLISLLHFLQGRAVLQDVVPAFLLSLLLPLIACLVSLPIAVSMAVLGHRLQHIKPLHTLIRILDALAAIPPVAAAYAGAYALSRLEIPYSPIMAVALMIFAFLPRLFTQILDSLRALPPYAYHALRSIGSRRIGVIYVMLLRQARGGILSGVLLFVLKGLNELVLLQIAFGLYLSMPGEVGHTLFPISLVVREGVLTGNTAIIALAGLLLFSADILISYSARRLLIGSRP